MPPAPEPALTCRSLTRTFRVGLRRRPVHVLQGVDLTVAPGALLGLLGPNGSGKTTLLRLAAGADRPSGGELRTLGGSPAEAAVRRRLGYLPEDSPFPPELDARTTLELLGALQGMPRRECRTRAAALLERVGLAPDAGRRLGGYSRGMLRRFGLAQAFLHAPDLVLLDEPTAGLDATGFRVLEELVDEARARGAAVVLASHLLVDLVGRADELAVLFDGRVAARGAELEAEGRLELEVEGADAALVARIESLLSESGARLVARRPAGGAVVALYGRLAAAGAP